MRSCFAVCMASSFVLLLGRWNQPSLLCLLEALLSSGLGATRVPQTLKVSESPRKPFQNTKFCPKEVLEMLCLQDCPSPGQSCVLAASSGAGTHLPFVHPSILGRSACLFTAPWAEGHLPAGCPRGLQCFSLERNFLTTSSPPPG